MVHLYGSTVMPPPSDQAVSLPYNPDGSLNESFLAVVGLARRGDKQAKERVEYYRRLGVEVH